MASILVGAPDETIQSLAQSLSWWLKAQAKTFDGQQELFFQLANRLLKLDDQDAHEVDDDPVYHALNHPVGQVTQALLDWWYRRTLEGAQGLPAELKTIFTELCDTSINKYRYGRVLLAAHVIALYRVDIGWATKHLLPLFDWQRSLIEARFAWEGFLWSPRVYRPLLSAIKVPLLESAAKYESLGKHAAQYAAFLTFTALDPGDTFSNKELADAISHLPAEGLESSAQALVRALESTQDQRGEYWRNRLLPFLRNIWPKSLDLISPAISEYLARLCIATGESFPEAINQLRYSLQPVPHPYYLIDLLHEAKLCKQFPEDALMLLNSVISNDAQLLPKELQRCLNCIQEADQRLVNDPRFIRLTDLYRRHGLQ